MWKVLAALALAAAIPATAGAASRSATHHSYHWSCAAEKTAPCVRRRSHASHPRPKTVHLVAPSAPKPAAAADDGRISAADLGREVAAPVGPSAVAGVVVQPSQTQQLSRYQGEQRKKVAESDQAKDKANAQSTMEVLRNQAIP